MSEFDFIERIRARVSRKPHDLLLGIGDDAAVLREQSGRELLITTDLLVEDVDFKLDYIPPAWLGHKALAVSLSDIAAMGGTPRFGLLTLAIPQRLQPSAQESQISNFWDAFLDGYCALAETHQVTLIGGDISGMPERLAIDSVVLGQCANGKSVRRSSAQVGDAIFVTGELGASAVGLQLLLDGERVDETITDTKQSAIRAHLRPEPRVAFGQALGESGLAHAMLDVSDGLAQDLAHLCTASQVSATLFAEALPIADGASLPLALHGGEDFELLFTAEAKNEAALQRLADSHQLRLTRIGEIVSSRDVTQLTINQNGLSQPLTVRGFDHFRA